MKTRLQYLDVCKGMGILLVVLGHIFLTNPARVWIYSFHMPLFFFLSGYIFFYNKTTNFKEFIFKRFKVLIIPYFAFASVWYVYWLVAERKLRPESLDINPLKPLIGIFYGVGSETGLVFNIVLWFLPCLIITEIIFYLITKNIKNNKNIFIILFTNSIIGYLISIYLDFKFPWGINIMFTSIVFYGVGYFFHKSNLENKITSVQERLFIVILLFINVISAFINKSVDMNFLNLGNYFLYYISAISGLLFLYLISKKIQHVKWLSFLGKNTLVIMCIHDPIKRVVIKIVSIFVNLPSEVIRDSTFYSIICLFIIMIISIPIIYIANRYTPFVLGKFEFIKKEKDLKVNA